MSTANTRTKTISEIAAGIVEEIRGRERELDCLKEAFRILVSAEEPAPATPEEHGFPPAEAFQPLAEEPTPEQAPEPEGPQKRTWPLLPFYRDHIIKLAQRPEGMLVKDLIEVTGMDKSSCYKQVRAAEAKGIIESQEEGSGKPGRPRKRYRYIVPSAQPAARAKHAAREAGSSFAGAVPGTGKRRVSGRKDVRDLVKMAEAAGGKVLRDDDHVTISGPNGKTTLPSTPGDRNSLKNARRDLRRKAGLDV